MVPVEFFGIFFILMMVLFVFISVIAHGLDVIDIERTYKREYEKKLIELEKQYSTKKPKEENYVE